MEGHGVAAITPAFDAGFIRAARREANRGLEVEGTSPLRIAGIVTYADRPQAGATVELVPGPPGDLVGGVRETTTDRDGRFSFDVPAPAAYVITASLADAVATTVTVDLRDPTEAPGPEDQTLALGPCDLAIAGAVRDAAGRAMAHTRVRRIDGNTYLQAYGATTVADDAGRYRVCVPHGLTTLRFEAPGSATATITASVAGSMTRDVTLGREAMVTGRVVSMADGATDAAPVAGAEVNVASSDEGRSQVTILAVTDDDGRFVARGLPPGHLSFQVWGAHALLQRPVTLDVAAGEERTITIEAEPATVVTGVVSEDGAPVAGAQVATKSPGLSFHTRTDAEGRFTLDGVAHTDAGAQELAVEGYDVLAGGIVDTQHPDVTGVGLAVRAKPSVAGRVLLDGRPIAAIVRPCRAVPGTREEKTRPDGSFVLRALAPGPFCLIAASRQLGDAVTKEVTGTLVDRDEAVTLSFDDLATASGRVLDEDGTPVGDAAVTLERKDGGARIRVATAVDGTFVAGYLAAGEYDVTAMSAGGTARGVMVVRNEARKIEVPTMVLHADAP